MNKKLSVVVPVFCNSGSLPLLFKKLTNLELKLKSISIDLELIFIDDGSIDNSYEILKNYQLINSKIKVIKLTRNFGAIHASKCGFNFVTGDCFTLLAADLQDPPELIFKMAKKWLAGDKYIICERASRSDPVSSKFFAFLYYKLLNIFVLENYPKKGYDLALMDKVFLKYLINSSKTLYTPVLAYWLGFKPTLIPYHREQRIHGKSRWTFAKKFKAFINIIFGFSTKPIRIISFIGLTVSFFAFLYGVFIIFNAIVGNINVPGYATIITLISFLFGLVLLMLSAIAEYIWHISDELNKRPEYVIEKID